jgi:hypothetical protein
MSVLEEKLEETNSIVIKNEPGTLELDSPVNTCMATCIPPLEILSRSTSMSLEPLTIKHGIKDEEEEENEEKSEENLDNLDNIKNEENEEKEEKQTDSDWEKIEKVTENSDGEMEFRDLRMKCTHCDEAFAKTHDLYGHIRTHQNHTQCPYCVKQLSCMATFVYHVRTHTNEKPYYCPIQDCDFQNAVKYNLKVHLACIKHGGKDNLKKYAKVLDLDVCDKSLKKRKDNSVHELGGRRSKKRRKIGNNTHNNTNHHHHNGYSHQTPQLMFGLGSIPVFDPNMFEYSQQPVKTEYSMPYDYMNNQQQYYDPYGYYSKPIVTKEEPKIEDNNTIINNNNNNCQDNKADILQITESKDQGNIPVPNYNPNPYIYMSATTSALLQKNYYQNINLNSSQQTRQQSNFDSTNSQSQSLSLSQSQSQSQSQTPKLELATMLPPIPNASEFYPMNGLYAPQYVDPYYTNMPNTNIINTNLNDNMTQKQEQNNMDHNININNYEQNDNCD